MKEQLTIIHDLVDLVQQQSKKMNVFCIDHKDWDINVWKLLIFMDETTFTLGGYHHRLINCRKGEQWKPNHLGHCKKHGQGACLDLFFL